MIRSETPTQVGPYRLGSLLGRGGMGEVYRAYDQRLSRWVAVKQVRPDKEGSPRARNRLRREARSAAGLAHPAIVQIFDIMDVDEGCWIVMELVDGQTLASLLREGPLDVAVVARLGRQIAEGLAHAHDMGIVHRDLKVENVMLSISGRARILDFGLVKDLNDTEGTQTADGVILGTLRAMSPEQALGQAVDHRSDLFSLGTLLYECLTGVRPFEGSTAVATLQRVAAHGQESVRLINPEVPRELSGLIDRLLEKLPEKRPNATLVAEHLQQIERQVENIDSHTAAELVVAFRRGVTTGEHEGELLASTLGGEAGEATRTPRTTLAWRWGGLLLMALLAVSLIVRFGGRQEAASGFEPSSNLPVASGSAAESSLPETAFELYQKGLLLLEHRYRPGATKEAISIFRKLITREPNHAGAYAGLARGYLWQFEITKDIVDQRQAMQAAEKAVELDEQLAIAHSSLGLVHLAMGDLEAAQRALDRSLMLDPSSSLGHISMGRLQLARKQKEDAEVWFTKASRLGSLRHLAFNQLGVLFYTQGRYEEAAEAFSQSKDLVPGDATTLRNLGGALHMLGRTEEAAAALQESLVIEPRASVYNNLGTLLFFQGLYVDAASALEKAVELGPNSYTRWAGLGDAYRWVPGSETKAREAYEVALELLADKLKTDPSSPDLLSHGALYRAKLDNCTKSEDFSRLLNTEKVERGVVFFRLGIAAELCQRRDEALQRFERAMDLGYSREELTAEPELRSLRQDARFHRLVLGR